MRILRTPFDGLVIVEPAVYTDARGQFLETWRESRYGESGLLGRVAQDNVSWSSQGVLRGLHYQFPDAQQKLVHVLDGEIFDVVVDVRRGSATFAKWFGVTLSSSNHRQLFMPEGFAHGFCVMSPAALVAYKCSAEYNPDAETTIAWNDPQIAIEWPIENPILSEKDAAAPNLARIPHGRLPRAEESVARR